MSSSNVFARIRRLQGGLHFSLRGNIGGNPDLQLIRYCIRKLGLPTQELSSVPGDIEVVLDHNDIPYRRIRVPSNPAATEYPLLIVIDRTTDEPLALTRQGRRNILYSARQDRHWLAPSSSVGLHAEAFEVHASLPVRIGGPMAVLRFAFAAEWPAWTALLLTSAVVMAFNVSIPMLTSYLVNTILPQSQVRLLMESLAIVLLISIGSVAVQYLQNLMMLRLETVTDLRLQTAVWDRLLRLPLPFLTRYTAGDLSSRATGISRIRQMLGSGVLSTLITACFAVSYFVLMFIYDPGLAWWATGFAAIACLSMLWLAHQSIRQQQPLQETGAEITNFMLQALAGVAQIRTAGAEPAVLLRWLGEVDRYALLQLRANIYSDTLDMLSTLMLPVAYLVMFSVVTWRLLHQASTESEWVVVASFVAFSAAFSAFISSINGAIALVANVFGQVSVLWQRCEPVLYQPVERGYGPEALRHTLTGAITLSDVVYQYPDSTAPIFQGLTFSIPAGQQTAITGPSGCGKTTLVRLILGFYEPNDGEILVDGIPLSHLAIRMYRRQLGVVLQNARVRAGSIYEVVCGGLPRTDEAVWEALELAALANEVRAMPMQLETILSEGAGNISGGQRQRIAIARALINKPRILLLDEATSALDARSQAIITETISALSITRLTIAHRLSTIRTADQIVVIEKGQVSEQGSWHQLLDSGGYISRMLTKHEEK